MLNSIAAATGGAAWLAGTGAGAPDTAADVIFCAGTPGVWAVMLDVDTPGMLTAIAGGSGAAVGATGTTGAGGGGLAGMITGVRFRLLEDIGNGGGGSAMTGGTCWPRMFS